MLVDHSIAITPIRRFVIFSQRQESIRRSRRWLRRDIAEQFSAIINRAIAIPVKTQPGVVSARRSPRYLLFDTVGV